MESVACEQSSCNQSPCRTPLKPCLTKRQVCRHLCTPCMLANLHPRHLSGRAAPCLRACCDAVYAALTHLRARKLHRTGMVTDGVHAPYLPSSGTTAPRICTEAVMRHVPGCTHTGLRKRLKMPRATPHLPQSTEIVLVEGMADMAAVQRAACVIVGGVLVFAQSSRVGWLQHVLSCGLCDISCGLCLMARTRGSFLSASLAICKCGTLHSQREPQQHLHSRVVSQTRTISCLN